MIKLVEGQVVDQCKDRKWQTSLYWWPVMDFLKLQSSESAVQLLNLGTWGKAEIAKLRSCFLSFSLSPLSLSPPRSLSSRTHFLACGGWRSQTWSSRYCSSYTATPLPPLQTLLAVMAPVLPSADQREGIRSFPFPLVLTLFTFCGDDGNRCNWMATLIDYILTATNLWTIELAHAWTLT